MQEEINAIDGVFIDTRVIRLALELYQKAGPVPVMKTAPSDNHQPPKSDHNRYLDEIRVIVNEKTHYWLSRKHLRLIIAIKERRGVVYG